MMRSRGVGGGKRREIRSGQAPERHPRGGIGCKPCLQA